MICIGGPLDGVEAPRADWISREERVLYRAHDIAYTDAHGIICPLRALVYVGIPLGEARLRAPFSLLKARAGHGRFTNDFVKCDRPGGNRIEAQHGA